MPLNEFPKEIHKELGFYVYRLVDPRNGETFYVGKGKGNRVFHHVAAELGFENETDEEDWKENEVSTKLQTIRDIRASGLDVIHIVHRHGMDERAALQVEAALIDVYPGLTNEMRGHDAARGPAHVKQLVATYAKEEMEINDSDKLLLFKITDHVQAGRGGSVYDTVRWAWEVSLENAQRAEFILAIKGGLCVGVFVADKWPLATSDNFPYFQNEANRCGFPANPPNRYGFNGHDAPEGVRQRSIGKR